MRWLTLLAVAVSGVSLMACANGRPEPPQRITYVAVGASDAAGVGADPINRGYVFRIADELDERVDEVFLANLGLPGRMPNNSTRRWSCSSNPGSSPIW